MFFRKSQKQMQYRYMVTSMGVSVFFQNEKKYMIDKDVPNYKNILKRLIACKIASSEELDLLLDSTKKTYE